MSAIHNTYSDLIASIESSEITIAGAIFKMLLSMILGGAIGLERKRKGQIAGMRTFALISMGATLAMLLSIYIPQEYLGLKNGDPSRIAAQVITGVGFLGAGAIIQMKGSVRGLTTAAGIWMVSTIGMAVGVGFYSVAICATLMALSILLLFEHYERKVNLVWETKFVCIKSEGIIIDTSHYKKVFDNNKIHIIDTYIHTDFKNDKSVLNFVILLKDNNDYIKLFDELRDLNKIESITLTNELNI